MPVDHKKGVSLADLDPRRIKRFTARTAKNVYIFRKI